MSFENFSEKSQLIRYKNVSEKWEQFGRFGWKVWEIVKLIENFDANFLTCISMRMRFSESSVESSNGRQIRVRIIQI